MNTKILKMFRDSKKFITKYSPQILTGLGISGMLTTVVLAAKASPKAADIIDEKEEKRYEEYLQNHGQAEFKEMNLFEKTKLVWRLYLPATLTGTVSIACLIEANHIGSKRTAALATAYSLTERTLEKYKEKVIETIGEKKEKEIQKKVSQEVINDNKNNQNQVIITSNGNTLVLDSISGRYFRSDMDKIKKVINELNRQLTYENYISLNEFYEKMDLDPIKAGWDLGWNLDNGLIEPKFDTCLSPDDEPCIVLDYMVQPKYDYSKLG